MKFLPWKLSYPDWVWWCLIATATLTGFFTLGWAGLHLLMLGEWVLVNHYVPQALGVAVGALALLGYVQGVRRTQRLTLETVKLKLAGLHNYETIQQDYLRKQKALEDEHAARVAAYRAFMLKETR